MDISLGNYKISEQSGINNVPYTLHLRLHTFTITDHNGM